MMEDKASVDRADDGDINRLFESYLPRLIRFAEQRMAAGYERKFGADDVAATVCRTVIRRMNDGSFRFDDDQGFWRLLVVIAKRKICKKVRGLKTQSRSIDLEVAEAANDILRSPEPDPAEVAVFRDSLQVLYEHLDDKERQVLELRLQGHDLDEIAQRLDVVDRTVRRKMNRIQATLARLFADGEPDSLWEGLPE